MKNGKKNKSLYPHSKILQNTIGYREFFELEQGMRKDFNEAAGTGSTAVPV